MVDYNIKTTMTASEIAEVTQLFDAAEKADGRKPLNDHLWIDLHLGGRSGFAGLTARDPNTSKPIAYCQVSRSNDSWALDLVIAPNSRDQTLELGSALLTEASQIIKKQAGGHVHWWVSSPTDSHHQLAAKMNFKPGRNLLQMRVALPLRANVLSETKPALTRSFVVGTDEDAWLALNNRAFALHPAQGGWTREILQSRQSADWFNADGFLLHFINDQLAAFCWTKIDESADAKIGEIYVIAVDPQYHGQGLGRSLTVAGLKYLAGAQATTGMLFVDKENVAAVATYTKLGFTTHHQEQAFVADI